MKRLVWVVGLAVLVAGCASSPRPQGSPHPVGWVPPPPAPPSAVAFAQRLLDDAVLPPDVKPYGGPLPRWLRSDPDGTPALVNLVQAHRLWTLRSTAANVAGFLQSHRPGGFTDSGVGSLGTLRSRTDRALFTDERLAVLPPNISDAQLDVAVTDVGAGTVVIRADAQVAWTKPPDLVASIGPCCGVGATAGHHALPGLDPTGAFSTSVAHLLGSSELH